MSNYSAFISFLEGLVNLSKTLSSSLSPDIIPINGTSGTSGNSGNNGSSGTSGINGTSGTSGLSTVPPIPPIPTPTGSYVRKNLIYEGTFEGSNPFAGVNPQTANPGQIAQSKDFARAGTYSAKVVLNKTDSDIGSNKRSEMNRSTTAEPFKDGIERWYGASYYLPSSFITDPAPELLFQQHEYSGANPPHFAIWTINGRWSTSIDGIKEFDLGPHTTDKWTDFVIHYIWSTGPSGLIEIYKDGLKVKSYLGPNMPVDSYLPYLKLGIYKWPWKTGSTTFSSTTTRTVYIDEVRIGNELATYNDVKPG